MLGIRYVTHGHVSNSNLRMKCRLPTIKYLMRTRRLRWLGDVARMPDYRLPKKALFSRLNDSRRPIKSWRQGVVEDLYIVGEQSTWTRTAADRKVEISHHSAVPSTFKSIQKINSNTPNDEQVTSNGM